MTNLFGEEVSDIPKKQVKSAWHSGTKHGNPMVKVYGKGPEGTKCKSCDHLCCNAHNGKRYYKCEYRGVSASVTTDHLIGWPTCGKYQPQATN
jgi:hypothetical protein